VTAGTRIDDGGKVPGKIVPVTAVRQWKSKRDLHGDLRRSDRFTVFPHLTVNRNFATRSDSTVTEAELGQILASSNKRHAVLFALLAGTGLRIGAALALRPTDFSPDCRILHVRRSIWHGQEQLPKTSNALRVVDIAEPLAQLLRELIAGKSGYLFAVKSGRPLQQRNVLRALHATGKRVGLHAFRRFRTETLRRGRVPEDITRLWLGRSKVSVTDFYAGGLEKDEAWRQEWCDRAGLGFSSVGLLGLQTAEQINSAEAA